MSSNPDERYQILAGLAEHSVNENVGMLEEHGYALAQMHARIGTLLRTLLELDVTPCVV